MVSKWWCKMVFVGVYESLWWFEEDKDGKTHSVHGFIMLFCHKIAIVGSIWVVYPMFRHTQIENSIGRIPRRSDWRHLKVHVREDLCFVSSSGWFWVNESKWVKVDALVINQRLPNAPQNRRVNSPMIFKSFESRLVKTQTISTLSLVMSATPLKIWVSSFVWGMEDEQNFTSETFQLSCVFSAPCVEKKSYCSVSVSYISYFVLAGQVPVYTSLGQLECL